MLTKDTQAVGWSSSEALFPSIPNSKFKKMLASELQHRIGIPTTRPAEPLYVAYKTAFKLHLFFHRSWWIVGTTVRLCGAPSCSAGLHSRSWCCHSIRLCYNVKENRARDSPLAPEPSDMAWLQPQHRRLSHLLWTLHGVPAALRHT